MNRNIAVTQNYNIEIFPLNLIKSYLRIDGSKDDELILFLLNSVIEFAEEKLGIVIGKKDYEYTSYKTNEIFLPKNEIKTINYVRINNVDVSFTLVGNCLKVRENVDFYPVKINFTAENINIRNDIKLAILHHLFFIYENRSTEDIHSKHVDIIYNALNSNDYNI